MTESETRDIDAVVAGYIGVDLAPRFHKSGSTLPLTELIRPGKLVETDALSISLGGAVANTGLAMAAFGKRVSLNALIGEDLLGDVVLQLLERHGSFTGVRRTKEAGTAYGIVIAPPGTDRCFLESPGCNAVFSSEDIDYGGVSRSRLFHFGYPTLMQAMFEDGAEELHKMFARVKETGAVTSLDMTLPDPESASGQADWPSILARALPFVDIFVPSVEELLYMMDREAYARIVSGSDGKDIVDVIPDDVYCDLAGRVCELGANVLMIKAGHRGIYLRTGDTGRLEKSPLGLSAGNWDKRELRVPAFAADPHRVENACGAGDAAVAGFLTAMLNGETIERAGQFAALSGRDNLYGIDAVSGLSDWEAMERELSTADS